MAANKTQLVGRLREELVNLAHLRAALSVLDWDQQVNMPSGASGARAATFASLSVLHHRKFTSPEFFELVRSLMDQRMLGELDLQESCIVRETWRDLERAIKLPVDFVEESARITSEAHHIWAESKKKDDFKSFQPYLEKIVEITRRKAEFLGFNSSPYDALLDEYEPGATSENVSIVFEEIKQFLVPFIAKIQRSKAGVNPKILRGNFPLDEQTEFIKEIAGKIGFDFKTGCLDVSSHPFCTSFHPTDVRITTRFNEHDLFYALDSVIHEAGHALYEQGLLKDHFGTPMGEAISLGIHEFNSRTWENLVGKSMPFWRYFYPKLVRAFPKPFARISLTKFYNAINHVRPSLIRTEADEVTYNLHVILRFEIEKALIEGSIEVKDLPKIWNAKVKEYLGLKVPNDRRGVLQDVHWSGGSIGYFPTYTLGNLYSAQFYETAKKAVPGLEKGFAKGNFKPFREWLRHNVHVHGRMYSGDELVRKVTGEPLTPKYWTDYIEEKFSEIYNL